MALLMWQPWMSELPGCCFAEEACEAMLSRMASRYKKNSHLSQFQDVLWLFMSLPPPPTPMPIPRPAVCGSSWLP